MRVEVYVRPGTSTTRVGGTHGGVLVVRVVDPADAGRATEAAIRALATALDVPRRSVTLVRGATSRRKLLDIDVEPTESERVRAALGELAGRTGD